MNTLKKKRKAETYSPSQDFVPIDSISDGIVKLKNGNYIKTLEIRPTNFHMMDTAEQNNLIAAFGSFLKIAPIHVQFKILSLPASSSEHTDIVIKDAENDKDFKIQSGLRKELQQYVDLCGRLRRYTAVTRRFFIVFKHEYGESPSTDYADIVGSMAAMEHQIREYLSACGNYVVTHDNMDNENKFQAEIFYLLLNRASNISFEQRVKKTVNTFMTAKGLTPGVDAVPDIPISYFIAPHHINLTHRDWIYIDGTYYAFYIIAGGSYPKKVYATWLDELINFGAGVDVDIFSTRYNKPEKLSDLRRTLAFTKSKMRETSETNRDFEAVQTALESVYYIKDRLSNSSEDYYEISTLITITADSVKNLRKRIRRISDLLLSKDMKPISCYLRYEQAFLSSLPCAVISSVLESPAKRNILTNGLASIYPFTSFEVCHKDGIMLGLNAMNNSMFVINPYNAQYFQNANMMITGSSGGGKTFLLGMLMARFRMRGIQTFLVAPDKGYEFRRMCNHLGGTFVKICAGSPACINIFEIRPVNDDTDIAIEGDSASFKDSLLSQKIQDLKIFFSLLIPEITNVEQQRIDEILIKTYNDFGITKDNDSIYDASGNLKMMPTIGDFYNNLLNERDLKDIAVVVSTLVSGSAANFNGQTNVNLLNKLVVFDISELKSYLKPVGMYMVIDYLMSAIRADRTVNDVLMIDEMWQLISENRLAAEYVKDIWKTIRGYGGSAVGATQDLNDYFALDDGKYGKAILSASAIKILKKTSTVEAKTIRDVIGLTDSEYKKIMRLGTKQALFCTDRIHIEIELMATPFEKWNIVTDSENLLRLKNIGYDKLVDEQ